MEELLGIIHEHAAYAHWIIFGALLLAGFNIPVSEDAMLFISAYLAATHPEQLVPLFLGVYLGAFLSDVLCFFLGWFLGTRLFHVKFFAKMKDKVDKMSAYYDRYGVITLVIGRFIPFGVRNALFMTAGISRMNPVKFLLADWFACTVSVSAFFYLYYKFGEKVVSFVQQANIAIFALALTIVAALFVRGRVRKSRAADAAQQNS